MWDLIWVVIPFAILVFLVVGTCGEPERRAKRIHDIEVGTGCKVTEQPRPGCTQVDVSGGGRYTDPVWLCCEERKTP